MPCQTALLGYHMHPVLVATALRWEKPGMPVHRGGRYVYARPEELNRWVAKESSFRFPVHIATEGADLTSDLKRALSEAQHRRKSLAQSRLARVRRIHIRFGDCR